VGIIIEFLSLNMTPGRRLEAPTFGTESLKIMNFFTLPPQQNINQF
jgi:hypothetical protein